MITKLKQCSNSLSYSLLEGFKSYVKGAKIRKTLTEIIIAKYIMSQHKSRK